MSEHPKTIQQGVGPTIGVSQPYPAVYDWRLMLMYGAMAIAGLLLIAL